MATDPDPRLVRIIFGRGDVVDEVGRIQDFGEFVLQRGLLVGVGGLRELLLDGLGLLGLVDFTEDAGGDDFLLPLGFSALREGAEIRRLGVGGGGLGQRADVLAAMGEGDLETGARGDLAELEHEHVAFRGQGAVDAMDGDFGGEFVASLALAERERGGEAVGLHAATIGEVSEAEGFVQFTRDDREAAADDFDAADGFEFGALEEAGTADGVGEGDAVAGEVETEVLRVFARERAQRNLRHDVRRAGGELAGVDKASVLAPAWTGIGLGEEVGTFSGGRVRAVRTIEDHAFALEPATGPEAGATQGFGVEGVASVFFAEVHQDRFVGRAALLLKGVLSLCVVDGGAEEAPIVHVHVFAGRLSRGFLWGVGLFRGISLLGGVRGRGREGRERKSGQDHEGASVGEHKGERVGCPGV